MTRKCTPRTVSLHAVSITWFIRGPARLRQVSVSRSKTAHLLEHGISMRKTIFTKSLRTAGLFTLLLGSPVLLSLQGCTDLEENPVSSITPENFYRNEEEVIGGLASVYAELRNTL